MQDIEKLGSKKGIVSQSIQEVLQVPPAACVAPAPALLLPSRVACSAAYISSPARRSFFRA